MVSVVLCGVMWQVGLVGVVVWWAWSCGCGCVVGLVLWWAWPKDWPCFMVGLCGCECYSCYMHVAPFALVLLQCDTEEDRGLWRKAFESLPCLKSDTEQHVVSVLT